MSSPPIAVPESSDFVIVGGQLFPVYDMDTPPASTQPTEFDLFMRANTIAVEPAIQRLVRNSIARAEPGEFVAEPAIFVNPIHGSIIRAPPVRDSEDCEMRDF